MYRDLDDMYRALDDMYREPKGGVGCLDAQVEGPDAQTDLDGLDAQVEESQEASASATGVDKKQPESASACASVYVKEEDM